MDSLPVHAPRVHHFCPWIREQFVIHDLVADEAYPLARQYRQVGERPAGELGTYVPSDDDRLDAQKISRATGIDDARVPKGLRRILAQSMSGRMRSGVK